MATMTDNTVIATVYCGNDDAQVPTAARISITDTLLERMRQLRDAVLAAAAEQIRDTELEHVEWLIEDGEGDYKAWRGRIDCCLLCVDRTGYHYVGLLGGTTTTFHTEHQEFC